MRILHIATLVTPDGAYGGPIRVALNQLEELASLGHDVELVAGAAGFGKDLPTSMQHVPVSLFPARKAVPKTGFAGLVSPQLWAYLGSRLSTTDVVHVHLARDLITLPAASRVVASRTSLVVQPHGMIDVSDRRLAGAIDTTYTRRILRSAQRVLALTPAEVVALDRVARAPLRIQLIANGVPRSSRQPSTDAEVEVLFLARLHPRKRALHFVEMAHRLIREGTTARFALVGPDEGDGDAVDRLISEYGISDRVRWEGAISPENTLERISRSSVFVLPSIGEVFPMSVLEAMSVGRAVVITRSNGLALQLQAAKAAVIVDESVEALVDAVRRLITDGATRMQLGARAREFSSAHYSIGSVASELETVYTEVKAQE